MGRPLVQPNGWHQPDHSIKTTGAREPLSSVQPSPCYRTPPSSGRSLQKDKQATPTTAKHHHDMACAPRLLCKPPHLVHLPRTREELAASTSPPSSLPHHHHHHVEFVNVGGWLTNGDVAFTPSVCEEVRNLRACSTVIRKVVSRHKIHGSSSQATPKMEDDHSNARSCLKPPRIPVKHVSLYMSTGRPQKTQRDSLPVQCPQVLLLSFLSHWPLTVWLTLGRNCRRTCSSRRTRRRQHDVENGATLQRSEPEPDEKAEGEGAQAC